MACRSRAACFLICLAFLSGCGQRETAGTPALNQLSREQLRLMLKGFPGDWRADTGQSKGWPEPPGEKPSPAQARRIPLPPSPALQALGRQTLGDAIARRRSVRSFTRTPLSLDELAYLLWATQGITHTGEDESGRALPFRAAPSGGGRYPLETYLAVSLVDGLEPGLYRYLPREHQLVFLRAAPGIGQEVQQACYGQDLAREAAVSFIWTAIPRRTEWKYAYLAPRLIAIEAGHVCQNLYLAAGSIQAGVCALLSYHQPALDILLDVDGEEEFTLYLACLGKTGPG